MDKKDICIWDLEMGEDSYKTACGKEFLNVIFVPEMRLYEYCPYCAKKLVQIAFMTMKEVKDDR